MWSALRVSSRRGRILVPWLSAYLLRYLWVGPGLPNLAPVRHGMLRL